MAEPSEPDPFYIESEREIDSCRRLSPGSVGGCSYSCVCSPRTYRLQKKQKEECQITFIGRTLGKGGFGTVRQVYDKTRGLNLVLKIVKVAPLGGSPEWPIYRPDDFPFAEIDVLARFCSCSIPYLTDVVVSSQCSDLPLSADEIGLVMPYAPNSLRDFIDDEAVHVGPEQLLSLLHSMGLAVYSLHQKLFLHRDIKPENFLCSDDQLSVVVTDFGLSCRMLYPGEVIETPYLVGTAFYNAPELDHGKYSSSSDIFALALAMVELVTKPSREAPLVKFEALASGAAVAPGFENFSTLDPESQQTAYLHLGMQRFGVSDGWEVAQALTRFGSGDLFARGSLKDFLRLPVFQRFPKQLAIENRPRLPATLEANEDWNPSQVWQLLSVAEVSKADWTAHPLVCDLAQRIHLAGRRRDFAARAKYAPFSSFETALFAVAAINSAYPQLGLREVAVRAMITKPSGAQLPNLMERFAVMARSEKYILEDPEILSCIETNLDIVILHYLVLSPAYLSAKRRGLSKVVRRLRSHFVGLLHAPIVKVGRPELKAYDLRLTHDDFGAGSPDIAEAIASVVAGLGQ